MKQTVYILKKYVSIFTGILIVSCDNDQKISDNTSEKINTSTPSNLNLTVNESDTLLYVNYESGTVDSGITGINPTNATANDAAYIVGVPSTYRIAHKVILGNPDYYSNEAYRSESDAVNAPNAKYLPGDERRYEFMVLLKDWQEWDSTKPAYGDNIFQLKVSGGALVPVRILTKRNAIVTRNTSYQDNLINDFRPYINQWISFRIDVKWATTNTGYLKIYTKLPGQTSYNLVLEKNNYATYTGNPEIYPGQYGYIKWGLYREAGYDANGNLITSDNILTRIAYHDNIRIIKLPLQ